MTEGGNRDKGQSRILDTVGIGLSGLSVRKEDQMGYGTSAGSSGGGFAAFLLLVIPICYLVAWVLAMGIVTKAAKEKGYDDLNGKLWFIGLFGFVFTPAIIVSALPDRRLQSMTGALAETEGAQAGSDELPDL